MRNLGFLSQSQFQQAAREEVGTLLRFCLVGLSGVGVSLGTLFVLKEAGVYLLVSAIFAHIFSVTNNFAWNNLWTFRGRFRPTSIRHLLERWLKFLLSTTLAAGVFLGMLHLLTDVFGLFYVLAALCAIAVSTPANFLASNFWVWKRSRVSAQHESEPPRSGLP